MKRWLVETGNVSEFVNADTPLKALELALIKDRDESLAENIDPGPYGDLASVLEVTEHSEHFFFPTPPTLQDVGIASQRIE